MEIKAYLKPHCGWSKGVRAVLQKHNLAYADIDIINVAENYVEMVGKSGQRMSPCVELLGVTLADFALEGVKATRTATGVMLADVSGEEVEAYLVAKGLTNASDTEVAVPTDRGCSDAEHERMRAEAAGAAPKTVRFF
jgi:glutaredoxin